MNEMQGSFEKKEQERQRWEDEVKRLEIGQNNNHLQYDNLKRDYDRIR